MEIRSASAAPSKSNQLRNVNTYAGSLGTSPLNQGEIDDWESKTHACKWNQVWPLNCSLSCLDSTYDLSYKALYIYMNLT